jgi:hypothetical protein
VVLEEPISLFQGQGEGDTLKEACTAARDDLKANANCGSDVPLKILDVHRQRRLPAAGRVTITVP